MLHTHSQLLKTVLLILCIGDFYLNLRHVPLAPVQISNWNIAFTYEQLEKIKSDNTKRVYREIAQHFKKCVKCCAKHNFGAKLYPDLEKKELN